MHETDRFTRPTRLPKFFIHVLPARGIQLPERAEALKQARLWGKGPRLRWDDYVKRDVRKAEMGEKGMGRCR